jgi:DNA (cytosine-5)-methyltransferase 1
LSKRFKFIEFFAGGGMARCGLGSGWDCLLANDIDARKASSYRDNWGDERLVVADINALRPEVIPHSADLVWASFPCQDLSLAGAAAGLGSENDQTRSGAFWGLWRIILSWQHEGKLPPVVALENVYGLLTANGGRDFAAIVRSLSIVGYRVGGVVLDGRHFVPQSRPRVFIVAVRLDCPLPAAVTSDTPIEAWHPKAMQNAVDRLSELDRDNWFWLRLPTPPVLRTRLEEIILDCPEDVAWHSSFETNQLTARMSDVSLTKLKDLRARPGRNVATVYRRTRMNESGQKVQRSELRTDGLAGCLRTPGGGSSRQFVIVSDNGHIRSRLLSSREAARLMGLPDSYELPKRYNEAYHLAGDGLVVPAVRYLAQHAIEPVLIASRSRFLAEAAE